jgi:hypothetical protein
LVAGSLGEALVVIVNGDGENFFGLLLADDVEVELFAEFYGGG